MIIRAVHDKHNPFFQLRRDTAQDTQLSSQALGLLAYLMSKPNDWEPSITDIRNRFRDIGRNKAYQLINEELIPLGYARRVCEKDDTGRVIRWVLEIYESPVPVDGDVEPLPDIGDVAKPVPQNREVESSSRKPVPQIREHTKYREVQNTESKELINKQNTDSDASAPPAGLRPTEFYDLFTELYRTAGGYQLPYRHKQADFMQRAKLYADYKRMNLALTVERVTKAAKNYFATPQSKHTLADFCVRFNEFYEHAFDRYGKPIIQQENGNGRTQVTHRETPNARNAREMAELFERSANAIAASDGDSGADKPDSNPPWIAADFCRV